MRAVVEGCGCLGWQVCLALETSGVSVGDPTLALWMESVHL